MTFADFSIAQGSAVWKHLLELLWYQDPVPSKDMQTPSPSLPSVLLSFLWKMRTELNQMNNQFSDFFLSYSWLYLLFTKNLQTKKKVFQNDFEIWSIFMYTTSCMQKTEGNFEKYAVDANQRG